MSRGFAAIYILVGILILVALGGVYYFGKHSNQPPVSQPQVSPTLTPTIQTDETYNWKVLSDQGVSLRYPEGWSMRVYYEQNNIGYDRKIVTGFQNWLQDYNSSGNTIVEWNEKFAVSGSDNAVIQQERGTIIGRELRAHVLVNKTVLTIAGGPVDKVINIGGTSRYFSDPSIRIPSEISVQYQKQFEKILSTFKFN